MSWQESTREITSNFQELLTAWHQLEPQMELSPADRDRLVENLKRVFQDYWMTYNEPVADVVAFIEQIYVLTFPELKWEGLPLSPDEEMRERMVEFVDELEPREYERLLNVEDQMMAEVEALGPEENARLQELERKMMEELDD